MNECRENQNLYFIFSNVFPKFEPFFEVIWKNIVEANRTQVTVKYAACALHAG